MQTSGQVDLVRVLVASGPAGPRIWRVTHEASVPIEESARDVGDSFLEELEYDLLWGFPQV